MSKLPRVLSLLLFSCPRPGDIARDFFPGCCYRLLAGSRRDFYGTTAASLGDPLRVPVAPVAPKRPLTRTAHGFQWCDPYHWLSNPADPATLDYLNRENTFADSVMRETLQLQHSLEIEMESRLGKELSTPPERWGSWWYYTRVPEGEEYPVYCRKRAVADCDAWTFSREEVLLDQNVIAQRFGERAGYAHLGMCKLSGDQQLMAYTLDVKGREEFTMFVKDLTTGQLLSEHTTEGIVSVEWARNKPCIFYTVTDSQMRPSKIYQRTLDSSTGNKLVLEDNDASRFVDVARTKDWRFITLNVNSKTSSEVYLLDAKDPEQALQRVEPRRSDVEYFVEHHDGFLYILTNSGLGCNYRLVQCPVDSTSSKHWQEVVAVEDGVSIEDMDIFHKHLVLYERRQGLPIVQVLDLPLSNFHKARGRRLALPQQVCTITPGANQDFFSSTLRITVASPTMPEAVFNYDLVTGEATLLQQEEFIERNESTVCPAFCSESSSNQDEKPPMSSASHKYIVENGGRDLLDLSNLYVCERVLVPSTDEVKVPLTLIYHRKFKRNGSNPALLIGYGAYGEVLETDWCSDRLSLLNRGWVLAFAHVRGGGELGKSWHHAGRLMKKANSIQDFLACATYLLDYKYAHQTRLAAWGISAGGLLVGAAINLCPNLFNAVILKVPFLDLCNTMLDTNLPLTVHEYDEWGNPQDPSQFHYMRSYSPCDTVKIGASYPAMLVMASFHDTRVGYWEAAKWVAKIRDYADNNTSKPVLLKTSMTSGHFGEGGRHQHLKAAALEYAFLMKMMGT